MRLRRIVLVTIVTMIAASSSPALRLGAPVPSADVKMRNVDGRELSIADIEGLRGTLVIFSCNACPWVKAWEQRIADIGNTYRQRGIGVIAVNSNDPGQVPEDRFEVMQERAKQRGFAFPYVVDATSDVARAFGATHTPEAYLFDAGGKLVYHGAIDDNARHPGEVTSHYLRNALDTLLAGRPVAPAETKALGCTIKFRGR